MATAEDVQKLLCLALSGASYEGNHGDLRSSVEQLGARLLQTWDTANSTQGYWAFTAEIKLASGEDVLALVFRGTTPVEFLEYPGTMIDPYKPLHPGRDPDTFRYWVDVLDTMWVHQGRPSGGDDGQQLTMEQVIWEHLATVDDGKVWITGHSKGGAIATTAAARVVVRKADSPQLSPEQLRQLGSLSVLSFNAPKALSAPLAEEYDGLIQQLGINHRRIFNKADSVRKLPLQAILRHVGTPEADDRAGSSRAVGVVKKAVGVTVGLGLVAIGSCMVGGGVFFALYLGNSVISPATLLGSGSVIAGGKVVVSSARRP